MVIKRILLFGGNGQIGSALRHQTLPADWHMGVYTRAECDLINPIAISKAIRDFAPDLVINAAAMTDVDSCEREPDLAMRINFEAVAAMAGCCAEVSAPLIHLSTDYVFDGADGEKAYRPEDGMNPINAYGASKMMGEEAARHGIHWHVILRISGVFSRYGGNVLTRTIEHIDKNDEIKNAADQTSNPTSAETVAEALITIGKALLGGKADGFGTFHLTDEGAASRFEFMQAVMAAYAPYTERRPLLTPVRNADISGRAPRPVYSVLDTEKIQRVYGIQTHPWQDRLAASVKAVVEKRA